MARTDAELVEATLAGDPHAFEELVERYQRLVFNIIFHYAGFRNEVEDMAQEVFLKVYRSLDTFDLNRPFKAWIARITTNSCLDLWRRAKKQRVRFFSDLTEEEEQRIELLYGDFSRNGSIQETDVEELFRLLGQLMEKLHPKDKMAFVLRELEGLSYAEVAESMKCSEMAARIRVSRSKKKLQEALTGILAPESEVVDE